MGIVLTAIGKVDSATLERLKNGLSKTFKEDVVISKGMPDPVYAYNKKRLQYLATDILDALIKQTTLTKQGKVLGIVDHDLYVPDLNFVFGLAHTKGAVISITRLRQEFYGLTKNEGVFHQRVITEAVHELGHTYGLGHCNNPHCVMFFSNSLADTDRKGSNFCNRCRDKLAWKGLLR
jgi:archaemetzincin